METDHNPGLSTQGIDYNYLCSPEDAARIEKIAATAEQLFPVGNEHESVAAFRDQVRAFAHKNGFSISTEGHKLVCSRFAEPTRIKNKEPRRSQFRSQNRE